MNEQEAYKTVVKNQIVNNDAVRRGARTAAQEKRSASGVWRPVGIALAALLLVCGVVMTIPSARAEILSWFGMQPPSDYLAADPDERTPNPELDALIVTPAPVKSEITVNFVSDTPYWREIGENFSATLGETMFDGTCAYIMIDFDGLSGYAVHEDGYLYEVPKNTPLHVLLGEKLEPEMVRCFREDRFDDSAFLNGSMEAWTGPDNFLYLTTESGMQLAEYAVMMQVMRPEDLALRNELIAKYGDHTYYSEEAAAEWRERTWEHYRENGLRAYAYVYLNRLINSPLLDENGILRLHARYNVSIDHGQTSETKLDVDLGTVEINMKAYQNLKKRQILASSEPVTLSGETAFSYGVWTLETQYVMTNYSVDLNGVAFRVAETGTVDGLGIHNLKIHVAMPDDWSDTQKFAFAKCLSFDIRFDEEQVTVGCSADYISQNDGYLIVLNCIGVIPSDRLASMTTIQLIPQLTRVDTVEIRDSQGGLLETVPLGATDSFDESTLAPGTCAVYNEEVTEHPEWAITLTVN